MVLVTGGCGYIGQHVVRACVEAGHEVSVVDKEHASQRFGGVTYYRAKVDDRICPPQDAIIHLAALISTSASVSAPGAYWHNNVSEALELVGNTRFIFASSAAVYAPYCDSVDRDELGIDEDWPCVPSSPYGDTKYAFERILAAYKRAYGLDYVALRLFNVAGGRFPERHDPETHLVPLLVDAAIHGTPFTIYGTDFDTPDGTCVRDYVSAEDVARACVLALDAPISSGLEVMNIGQGTGYSVREVIRTVERITERTIDLRTGPRREGDPPYLVADIERAEKVLGWLPTESLEAIVRDVVRNRF